WLAWGPDLEGSVLAKEHRTRTGPHVITYRASLDVPAETAYQVASGVVERGLPS
ncbi:MAG: hypothetical protein V7646_2187, partial [Pseudonocardia sp.]